MKATIYLLSLLAISACSVYSSNNDDVPFDANNSYCQTLWKSIHNAELGRKNHHVITNDVGQEADFSQLEIDYQNKVLRYEKDCETPASYKARTKPEITTP